MDSDELFMIICILGLIFTPLFFMLQINLDAIANAEATTICQEKGFETFVNYDRTWFSSRPAGIVCGKIIEQQIQTSKIKAYTLDGNGNIILKG